MDKNLLFILVIIATVVINIIKAVNKKKAQSAPPRTTTPPASANQGNWQEVLNALMKETPGNQFQEQKDYPEAQSLETPEPFGGYIRDFSEYNFDQPVSAQSSLQMEGFDIQPTTTHESFIEDPIQPKGPYKLREALHKFDLRNAIIYNAILTRPYS